MGVVQNEYGFFNLRIDETLNDQLVKIAAEEGRSKNKQIEYILKEYVKGYLRSENSVTINRFQNDSATINLHK